MVQSLIKLNQMDSVENFIRAINQEINRDLSVMSEEYQKGHKSAMKHAKDLFDIWFPIKQVTK